MAEQKPKKRKRAAKEGEDSLEGAAKRMRK